MRFHEIHRTSHSLFPRPRSSFTNNRACACRLQADTPVIAGPTGLILSRVSPARRNAKNCGRFEPDFQISSLPRFVQVGLDLVRRQRPSVPTIRSNSSHEQQLSTENSRPIVSSGVSDPRNRSRKQYFTRGLSRGVFRGTILYDAFLDRYRTNPFSAKICWSFGISFSAISSLPTFVYLIQHRCSAR